MFRVVRRDYQAGDSEADFHFTLQILARRSDHMTKVYASKTIRPVTLDLSTEMLLDTLLIRCRLPHRPDLGSGQFTNRLDQSLILPP